MFSTISIYWIISLIIIIGLVIYYSNTIEGLENNSNEASKYNESLNYVNNMLNLISIKLRDGDVRGEAALKRLNSQIEYLTYAKKKFTFMLEQYGLIEQLRKVTTLNIGGIQQEIDDLIEQLRKLTVLNTETLTNTDGTQSEIDGLMEQLRKLKTSTKPNMETSSDTTNTDGTQSDIDDLMEQLRKLTTLNTETPINTDKDTQLEINNIINEISELKTSSDTTNTASIQSDIDTTNIAGIRSKIDNIKEKIQKIIGDKIKTITIESNDINNKMTAMRKNANTETPPDMIYEKLDLIIQGKSTSYGVDASTTYTIPLKDNGDIDSDKFYDYIDDESVKRKADSVDQSGTAWVLDKDGNMVSLASQNKLNDYIKYYEPGTYKYNIQNYTPSYNDSVYLSKTTGKPAFSKFIDNASIKKGICSQYKDFPDKLDEECGKLDKNVCGSVDCCTLLGGSKCVAGNNQGPLSKLHYGNQLIRNRDFYYYKGLCYGNCVKTKTDQ